LFLKKGKHLLGLLLNGLGRDNIWVDSLAIISEEQMFAMSVSSIANQCILAINFSVKMSLLREKNSQEIIYRYFSVQFKIQRLCLTERDMSAFISAGVAVKRCSQDLNLSASEAELRPIFVRNAEGSWMSPIFFSESSMKAK
jgi:hypothetical protein